MWLVIVCPNRVAAAATDRRTVAGSAIGQVCEDGTTVAVGEIRQSSTSEGDVPFGVRHSGSVGNVLDSAGDASSHIYRLGSAFAGHEKVSGSHACPE